MLDGKAWKGVFTTAGDKDGQLMIALKHARELVKKIDKDSNAEKPRPLKTLKFSKIRQLKAEEVSFAAHDVSANDDLRTDEAISRGKG